MADLIPALTLWQPWASLVVAGVKPHEFRGWAAPPAYVGRRIAIHAGARVPKREEIADLIICIRRGDGAATGLAPLPDALVLLERFYADPFALPLASILGTAILGTPVRAQDLAKNLAADTAILDSDRIAHGLWAWPLTEVETLRPFVPAKGKQGFWMWDRRDAA